MSVGGMLNFCYAGPRSVKMVEIDAEASKIMHSKKII